MTKLNPTPIIITVLVIAAILTGVFMFKSAISATTVSATGNYQMTVAPDEAVVYVLVLTKGDTAESAKNENSRISAAVLASLNKIGIEQKDIQTENFNIYPEYDWSNGSQRLIGYAASNYVRVKTKNFDNVGKIVDAAADAGALINSISFELSNAKNNEYKTTALSSASQDAKRKAEATAGGLGKKLGDLVSVQSSDYNYAPYPIYARAEMAVGVADAKVAATNIQPKDLEVSATVSVTYKIK